MFTGKGKGQPLKLFLLSLAFQGILFFHHKEGELRVLGISKNCSSAFKLGYRALLHNLRQQNINFSKACQRLATLFGFFASFTFWQSSSLCNLWKVQEEKLSLASTTSTNFGSPQWVNFLITGKVL